MPLTHRETIMTLALSYRHYVGYVPEWRAPHTVATDVASAGLDECLDDELAHDTADVCRKIALNGMISPDAGSFDGE